MKILEVKDLSLHYGDQSILKNISFSVEKGKIIGLLGPNGAGKSSILKILAGLVFPEKGSASIEGKSLKSFSELRSHCGYLIDAPSFYPYLSAIQNLKLIKKINNSSVDLAALLTMVGLGSVDRKKVKYFSMGMKQRLAIAQALLRSPRILILDEPFNGLDPNGFQDLIKLLEDLNKSGITIFISSHLLNELEQLSDYFILLHKGNIELDSEKLPATFEKIPKIFKPWLESQYPEYTINTGILNWGVYERSDLSAGLSHIRSCEKAGVRVDHFGDFCTLIGFEWPKNDFYEYFKERGMELHTLLE